MILMCFDTETTGLILKDTTDVNKMPHIIQISWVIYNTFTDQTEEKDFILRVPCEINNSRIHGITKKISDSGYDFGEIVDIFLSDLQSADLVVGYNLQFDLHMLEIELARLDRWNDIDIIYSKKSFDVMKQFKGKYIKLTQMYHQFFNENFNAHCAIDDVKATLKCYMKINSDQKSLPLR